jgi:hypothetical protein
MKSFKGWLCSKAFKRFRSFRIELNRRLERIESRILKHYYCYEIVKKGRLDEIK